MTQPSTTEVLALPARSEQYGLFLTPIRWTLVKNRNPKIDNDYDCLMLSDRAWKEKGGPVYRLFAGVKQCKHKISQFLCERDMARNNTNASVTTTSLFTLGQNALLDQNYTAISVWPSLTHVKSTMIKGKVTAS